MANNTIAMDFLKENSIRVYSGMVEIFPQFSHVEITMNVSDLTRKFDGCYAIKKATVCFVSGNEVYATPYTLLAINTLCTAGFQQKSFYVPFGDGEYPKDEKEKWSILHEKAEKSTVDDFVSDCCAYCEKHNVGKLNRKTLKKCFEIPESGVRVRKKGAEKCYYPIIRDDETNCGVVSYIGSFCVHNGVVIFVYRDGKTYVTTGIDIQQELVGAGYTKANMFVPFSNGEYIMDPGMKARWRAIIK